MFIYWLDWSLLLVLAVSAIRTYSRSIHEHGLHVSANVNVWCQCLQTPRKTQTRIIGVASVPVRGSLWEKLFFSALSAISRLTNNKIQSN